MRGIEEAFVKKALFYQAALTLLLAAGLVKLAFVALAFVGVFLWVEPLSAAALFGCFLVVHLVPALTAARASTGRRKR